MNTGETTLRYRKSKLFFMLLGVAGTFGVMIFAGYRIMKPEYPYGTFIMYFSGLLFALIVLITAPALLDSKPAFRINQRGFFASGFLLGAGSGWIGWKEVAAIEKGRSSIRVELMDPEVTKERISWVYRNLPALRTPYLILGRIFSLGITIDVFFGTMQRYYNEFKMSSGTTNSTKGAQFQTKDFHKTIYGNLVGSEFQTLIVTGPKYFKYRYSDTLFSYANIRRIRKKKCLAVGLPIPVLAPCMTIEMVNGDKIRIEYHIMRQDAPEWIDEGDFSGTKAFHELVAFMERKKDEAIEKS